MFDNRFDSNNILSFITHCSDDGNQSTEMISCNIVLSFIPNFGHTRCNRVMIKKLLKAHDVLERLLTFSLYFLMFPPLYNCEELSKALSHI